MRCRQRLQVPGFLPLPLPRSRTLRAGKAQDTQCKFGGDQRGASSSQDLVPPAALHADAQTAQSDDTKTPTTATCKPALPPEARGSRSPAAFAAAVGSSTPVSIKKKPRLPPEAKARAQASSSAQRKSGGDSMKTSVPSSRQGGAVKGGWCVSTKVERLDAAALARAQALEREAQRVAMEQARKMTNVPQPGTCGSMRAGGGAVMCTCQGACARTRGPLNIAITLVRHGCVCLRSSSAHVLLLWQPLDSQQRAFLRLLGRGLVPPRKG